MEEAACSLHAALVAIERARVVDTKDGFCADRNHRRGGGADRGCPGSASQNSGLVFSCRPGEGRGPYAEAVVVLNAAQRLP